MKGGRNHQPPYLMSVRFDVFFYLSSHLSLSCLFFHLSSYTCEIFITAVSVYLSTKSVMCDVSKFFLWVFLLVMGHIFLFLL